MNTRIPENHKDQSFAQHGARMLTEEEMDVIAGGSLVAYANGETKSFYLNEAEMRSMFLNDRTKYEDLVKDAEHYKALGYKLGTIVEDPFTRFVDIPPAFFGPEGISG